MKNTENSRNMELIYIIARFKFVSDICNKLPYLSGFYNSLERHYHVVTLCHKYAGHRDICFASAVYQHFESCAADRSM